MTPHLMSFSILIADGLEKAKKLAALRAKPLVDTPTRETTQILTSIAISALLLIAFALRAWGNDFGMPFWLHPDEQSIVERALAILRTGDYNPKWFHYPSLYIYVQAVGDIFVYLTLAATGTENIALPTIASQEYIRLGRIITAVMGSLTVLVVYFTGRTLISARIGLMASALLSFSLLHTIHSHYVTTDVPMALFATLSFLMSVMVLRTAERKYYVLAGLTAGLAASTKYNGAIVLVSLLVAHYLVARRHHGLANLSILYGLVGFSLAFMVGTPYAFADLPTFLKDLAFEIAHYTRGQPGFEGGDSFLWYMRTVFGSWDGIALLFSLSGAVICLLRRRPSLYLLLAFPAVYFWWFSSFVVRFERNLVPLTPFLAIMAAVSVDWLAAKVIERWRQVRRFPHLVLAGLLALAMAPSLVGIMQFNQLLSAKHPKLVAAEWANSNLPQGSKIAVEHYGTPVDPKNFNLENVFSIARTTPDWLIQQQFEYVIISDGLWQRLFLEPEKYQEEVSAYRSISERFSLVKAVEPVSPSPLLVSYPTVEVYHLPNVRIYKVSEVAK